MSSNSPEALLLGGGPVLQSAAEGFLFWFPWRRALRLSLLGEPVPKP